MADTKIVVDCSTGEVSEIELTAEEVAQREADAKEHAEAKAQEEADKAAAEAAKADLLARLGITADEAKLLLG
jgi:membrane protein involved in colicin uptake